MKTLIIGGGMAGLTYGIVSVKNGIQTIICERNSRVGKKIAVTGNGKCNIGNENVSAECFNNSPVVADVLSKVPHSEYLRFLNSCGIQTFADACGRVYPLSESAANVVDCLRSQFAKFGGKLVCDCTVTEVKRVESGFSVNICGQSEHFDKVIVACGSASGAAPTHLCDIVGSRNLTKLVPSLVPVKIDGMYKSLNGLRAKANVTLCQNGQAVREEKGEVQFKDYGLSGICIFNLSAVIARNAVLGKEGKYTFLVDVVPAMDQCTLQGLLSERIDSGYTKENIFYGILHNKLSEHITRRTSFNAEALSNAAKQLCFKFEKLLDFSVSQVTAGGVDERYLDNLTLENGITVLGEALNVDGICGGNNLYFAAASALSLFTEQQRNNAFNKQ